MSFSKQVDVRITDTSLRDGSHAVSHSFTVEQVTAIATGLDRAGVPVIEIAHGDGLSGSSLTYGRSAVNEFKLISAAVEVVKHAKIASLILPGVGTRKDIKQAADLGVGLVRVATHASEANVGSSHFNFARELGLETAGFLMMSHTISPSELVNQGQVMASSGCQCVYVVDSAGAMIPDEVSERVTALVSGLQGQAQVGFHGHRNLGLAEANTLAAVKAGAVQIDGSLRAFGAGSGNAQTELLAVLLDRQGLKTAVNAAQLIDLAQEVAAPLLQVSPVIDRDAITLGSAGVYSSFLKHARAIASERGVAVHRLLQEAGARGLVGGQEDLLVEIVAELEASEDDVLK